MTASDSESDGLLGAFEHSPSDRCSGLGCPSAFTTYNSQWLESGGLDTYDPPLASRSGLLVDPGVAARGSLRVYVLCSQFSCWGRIVLRLQDPKSARDEDPGPAGLIEASESSLFSG